MGSSVIKISDLVTQFGSQTVHDKLNLTISSGKIVAIIGASGSGKSVLLKQIIGLLRPTSGTVHLLGVDMHNEEQVHEVARKKIRRRFGVLFQNGALFSSLTVGQNVAVPLHEETSFSSDQIESLVALKLGLSELPANVAAKMPSELSGGMRKRAALARALALDPELLLLDEPTSGLDPITARAFDTLVRSLCDNLRMTIVIITHDVDTILSIVDELVVLADGRVITQGPPTEVRHGNHPWIAEYFSGR